MLKHIKIYNIFILLSIKILSIYRLTGFLVVLFGVLFTLIDVITTIVFFNYTESIAGYNFYEMLLVVGICNFVQYSYQLLHINAHEELAEKVIEGSLDYDLIRPINTHFLINYRLLDIPSLFNIIVSLTIVIYSIRHMYIGAVDIFFLLLITILGIIIYSQLNQMIVNICFFIEKPGALLAIPEYLMDVAGRPAPIYPKYILFLLSFIIPVLTITNGAIFSYKNLYPYSWCTIYMVVYSIILRLIIRVQWKYATYRYNSTS